MRQVAIGLCLALVVTTAARADDDDLVGVQGLVTQAGQPFCTDRDQLQEWLGATADGADVASLALGSCSTFQGSLRVVVLKEDRATGIVRVRVFLNRSSVVGYTSRLSLDAQ